MTESPPGEYEPAVRRVAIAGGFTAGHVNTGLVIARQYQETFENISILFIGAPNGFETRLVPPEGHRLKLISAAPVMNQNPLGKVRAVWRGCMGLTQARRLLIAERIQLVIGVGSYASAAAVLAARQLGIRTVIHEANEKLGAANRFAARFVDRIYLGSPSANLSVAGAGDVPTPASTGAESGRQRVVVTGNPVRQEIFACSGRTEVGRIGQPLQILVTGGSLGSHFLNEQAPGLLGLLAGLQISFEVHHQAGDTDLDAIRARYHSLGIRASVGSYFDDMDEIYAKAHFAISCAGAITLAELAACGLPSLVVPLGGAVDDHQVCNAIAYSKSCGALWCREADWDPTGLAAAIAAQLSSPKSWIEKSRSARRIAQSGAARMLVDDCEAMMTAHG